MNDKISAADAELDRLYSSFKKNVDVPSIMSLSNLERFAPLFSKNNAEACLTSSATFTVAVETELKNLSTELYRSVDPYKPIYIVPDDVKRQLDENLIEHDEAINYAIYVLPALYNRLHISDGNRELTDAFSNCCFNDDHNANSPIAIKRREIANAIGDVIAKSQSLDEIRQNAESFCQLCKNFADKNGDLNKSGVTAPAQQNENDDVDVDDVLGF